MLDYFCSTCIKRIVSKYFMNDIQKTRPSPYHIINLNTLRVILLKVLARLCQSVHGLKVLRNANAAGPFLHHSLHLPRHIIEANHIVKFLQCLLCIWKQQNTPSLGL